MTMSKRWLPKHKETWKQGLSCLRIKTRFLRGLALTLVLRLAQDLNRNSGQVLRVGLDYRGANMSGEGVFAQSGFRSIGTDGHKVHLEGVGEQKQAKFLVLL